MSVTPWRGRNDPASSVLLRKEPWHPYDFDLHEPLLNILLIIEFIAIKNVRSMLPLPSFL
jgi:hypothetical protein